MRFTPHRSRRTLVGAGAVAAVVAAGLATAPAASAATTDTWPWPAGGTIAVDGYGWGHGHGMSQYGAWGAAKSGLSYAQIISHYYPGATLSSLAEPALRVLIDADSDNTTEVMATPGLGVAVAGKAIATLDSTKQGKPVTRWRAVRSGSGVVVQYFNGSWVTTTVGGRTYHDYVDWTPGPSQTVRLVLGSTVREYRATAVRAASSGARSVTVVFTAMSDYLRSVVPSEMPSSWSAEALKAQAVAARSYVMRDRLDRAGVLYDTCSTTACQVYSGAAQYTTSGTRTRTFEAASTDAAVAATAGRVVTSNGQPAFTQFSASNGGWTTAGTQPYLKAFADPYDGIGTSGDPHHWTDTVSASSLQRSYPAIGTLQSVSVTRDGNGTGGGRVTSVVLRGSTGTVTISGSAFASAAGLKGVWWVPNNSGWSRQNALAGMGDFTQDGHPDLVSRDTAGRLWLHAATSGGAMAGAVQIGHGYQMFDRLTGPGDMNGDGIADLVGRTPDGRLYFYAGTGTGRVRPRVQIGYGFQVFDVITGVGDMNGDGIGDLVARKPDGRLYFYPGDGHGDVGRGVQIGYGFQIFDLLSGVGDLTGDGIGDLVARKPDGTLWLYTGDGHGDVLGRRQNGHGYRGYRFVMGVKDWTGDGKDDVLAMTSGGVLYRYAGTAQPAGLIGPRIVLGTP